MAEKKPLKIGTLNVKNIDTNIAYTRELLDSYDILVIQEHWLFSFQLLNLENIFPSHFSYSKAVDEDDPLPPCQKPRGYGGIAILYRKNMDFRCKKQTHGDNRIAVLEVQSDPPLIICNVYMPARNSKGNSKAEDSYRSSLDQLEEILSIYKKSHAVFILGDFNASLQTRKGNGQDLQLSSFVRNNDLLYAQSGQHTFAHPNKTDRAEIDYIFFNAAGEEIMDSVAVEPSTALNTSDHVPVYAVLKVKKREKTPSDLLIRCKPKWDKCDLHNYRDFISEHLQPFCSYRLGESPEFDILYPLSHLISVLQLATRDSIPSYKAEVKLRSRKQCPWSEKIQQAVKNSRMAWGEWKKAGSPLDQADPHVQKMSKSRKNLRKEQRREAASLRSQKVEHIMSEKDNSKTFFKLIKEQRKSSSTLTESLMVGNVTCTTDLEICNGWAEHFQSLATPLQNERFDSKYKDQVEKDIVSISSICENDPNPIALIETDEVQRAIGKLKNNKAADTIGLTSEHLKHGGHTLVCFMTEMLNYIIQTKKVSVVLKEGLVTPIFKKGDPTLPGNYRGITVTPVILKVLEHILNHRHNKILEPTQSWLQKGFTQGCSSLNAAVILTECIQESINTRQNLLLTTLDAQKAFDVVNHDSLLRRLYIDGIQGDDWLLVKDLYTDCTSKVKWAGLVSDPINIRQGVRQGGVLSTSHYKRYKNPLLLHLEESYSDVKIGSIKVPHITVADDLAVLSRDPGPQQVKVWDVDNNTRKERYCVNPSKSTTLLYHFARGGVSNILKFLWQKM